MGNECTKCNCKTLLGEAMETEAHVSVFFDVLAINRTRCLNSKAM